MKRLMSKSLLTFALVAFSVINSAENLYASKKRKAESTTGEEKNKQLDIKKVRAIVKAQLKQKKRMKVGQDFDVQETAKTVEALVTSYLLEAKQLIIRTKAAMENINKDNLSAMRGDFSWDFLKLFITKLAPIQPIINQLRDPESQSLLKDDAESSDSESDEKESSKKESLIAETESSSSWLPSMPSLNSVKASFAGINPAEFGLEADKLKGLVPMAKRLAPIVKVLTGNSMYGKKLIRRAKEFEILMEMFSHIENMFNHSSSSSSSTSSLSSSSSTSSVPGHRRNLSLNKSLPSSNSKSTNGMQKLMKIFQ